MHLFHRAFSTANLQTKSLDFGGFDSSIIFIQRGGIPRPTGNFPECLSQRILAGIILVGRLGAIALMGSCSHLEALEQACQEAKERK